MDITEEIEKDIKFQKAIKIVLAHEGGFVDDPDDPGGTTSFGISLRWLKTVGDLDKDGYLDGDLDHDGDVDSEDIRKMKKSDAIELYYTQWWRRYKYYRITDPQVATKIFDLSVNMGPKQCHKIVQRSLWACRHKLVDDGVLGPLTFNAINKVWPARILTVAIRVGAACFYRSLNRPKYIKGWLRRAHS